MTVIWNAKLDGLYDLRVERIDEYQGELIMTRGEMEIGRKTVPLAYGAIFGPDVADVAMWQDWAINIVDRIRVDDQA